jgi:spore germination protein GerM
MKRRTRVWDRIVLLAFLLILLVFGLLLARKYLTSTAPAPAPVATGQQQRREVVLYFGGLQGTHLVAETREIADCLELRDCLLAILQELVHGPVGELVPILPGQTLVREVGVAGDTATVDFSRDVIDGHPGGSTSELLTVYGVAETVAANFPALRQVRILVEGAPVETLKGHVDLRRPVPADRQLLQPPAAAAERK